MLVAIGTDLVEIERIQRVWERHRERFRDRVLSEEERAICDGQGQPWRYLARRWAAKEAIAKCLGVGIGIHLSWQDIVVMNAPDGSPQVALSDRGLRLAQGRGGDHVLLSISDERAYAVAFATLISQATQVR